MGPFRDNHSSFVYLSAVMKGEKVDNIVTGGGVTIGQKEDHALFDLFKF